MKICIKSNEFNPSFLYSHSEEEAVLNDYKIVEINDKYRDCAFEDFDKDFNFSIERYNLRKQKENAEVRIAELKTLLASTDYQAIKFVEGQISAEDYEPIKIQRQEWRDEINELEGGGNE